MYNAFLIYGLDIFFGFLTFSYEKFTNEYFLILIYFDQTLIPFAYFLNARW
jgi:hypothetical protein